MRQRLLEHPRRPRIGPPDPSMAARLQRSDVWVTAIRIEIPVPQLTIEHSWNILGYLRWYAPEVRATSDDDADVDLVRWLTGQPMWGAIACHLVQRGEIAAPWEAWEQLAAMGPMAWERHSPEGRA